MQFLLDAMSTGSLYALYAIGIALVFGIMRLINFAHGELIMVGAYVTLWLAGVPAAIVVIASIIAVALLALLLERVAFRPLRATAPSTLLISSFAISILIQNVMVSLEGMRGQGVSFGSSLNEPLAVAGLRIPALDLVTIIVTVLLIGGLAIFLRKARLGIEMRAAAENFQMARLLGIPANRVIATAFAVSGLFAGVAAILLVASTGTLTPQMGLQPVLIAFVATVLGGMGSLVGAALGGLLLGLMTVGLQSLLPLEVSGYRDAFLFLAVIFLLLIRPSGLFVKPSAERA